MRPDKYIEAVLNWGSHPSTSTHQCPLSGKDIHASLLKGLPPKTQTTWDHWKIRRGISGCHYDWGRGGTHTPFGLHGAGLLTSLYSARQSCLTKCYHVFNKKHLPLWSTVVFHIVQNH